MYVLELKSPSEIQIPMYIKLKWVEGGEKAH